MRLSALVGTTGGSSSGAGAGSGISGSYSNVTALTIQGGSVVALTGTRLKPTLPVTFDSRAAWTSSIRACYLVGEGAGTTTADASGNGHTGTFTGGAAWSSEAGETAAYFDGSSGYLDFGTSSQTDFGAGDFTISMRVSMNGTGRDFFGMNKWISSASAGSNNWVLLPATNGSNSIPEFGIEIGTTTYNIVAGSPVSSGVHVITGVRRGSQMELWVDAGSSPVTTRSLPAGASINANGLPMRFGTNGTASQFFGGMLHSALVVAAALPGRDIIKLAGADPYWYITSA